jgi:hydroxymethylpyrimidine kinase/phosphomethylpyrimidine kinase
MKRPASTPVALTIAGSDSGGGAGIQADLKVFHAHAVFGTSAITCLTAQNPSLVSGVHAAPAAFVVEQIERVGEAFPIAAAKTGMLYDAAIIEAVAALWRRRRWRNLVVDPVMVASSGARLLKPDAIAALTSQLLPQAAVITPNLAEAEVLWGHAIGNLQQQREAAQALATRFGTAVVVKGGHLPRERRAVDVLFDGQRFHEFGAVRVAAIKTHGTGCTFSAAIAANLALGHDLVTAVGRAKRFVTGAIRTALRIGQYQPLNV